MGYAGEKRCGCLSRKGRIDSAEFQRLGIMGDWAHPYTTMSYDAEAQIAREIARLEVELAACRAMEARGIVPKGTADAVAERPRASVTASSGASSAAR